MFSYWMNFSMLAMEAQQVVWLRTIKLALGGEQASREAEDMIAEKIAAGQAATMTLILGGSAENMLAGYRKKVRANMRRLSR